MAEDDLDLVFHLGDYIYEYGSATTAGPQAPARRSRPRRTTLADYRLRHAQYRTDPLLQEAHARAPGS